MGLKRAYLRYGVQEIRGGLPAIIGHNDVVFMPHRPGSDAWGIYDRQGCLVPGSDWRWGPASKIVHQRETIDPELFVDAVDAPDPVYVHGGVLHRHYGHFLVSTLARMWPLLARTFAPIRMIFNGDGNPEDWFQVPHFAFAFNKLGLEPANFARFSCPTRIQTLIVPHPSMEEEHYAHAVHAMLCNTLAADVPPDTRTEPVFFSKSRLERGIWRFTNEDEIAEVLVKHGVQIVHPEKLPLVEQIGLFKSRPIICGAVSSSLHTSVFAKHGAKIIGFNRDPTIQTNFTLLDAVNNTKAEYFYPADGYTIEERHPHFDLSCRLNDPIALAEDLLRMIDQTMSSPKAVAETPSRLPPPPSLDDIGLRHGTDKASNHHGFLAFYERFFEELRGRADLRILEIGVYGGSSLRMWAEYFPAARIVGLDVDAAVFQHATQRTPIEIVDQSNIADLIRIATEYGPFDLILDDGSHKWEHQITSLRTLYPFMKPGGYYVVEDLHTSYGVLMNDYRGHATMTAAAYLQAFSDALVAHDALEQAKEPDAFIKSYAPLTEFVAFHRRTCLLRRKPS